MLLSFNSLLSKSTLSDSKKPSAALHETLTELVEARQELLVALQNFDFASTSELVDLFSHQITLAQVKYDFIIKKARNNNISFDNYFASNIVCSEIANKN